jgi:hypothetical protein
MFLPGPLDLPTQSPSYYHRPRQPAQCRLQSGRDSCMVDDPAQNTLEDMTHFGFSLHQSAPHGMVAIVCRRHRLALAADANHVAGKRRHAQPVLHGGADLCILQLQSWNHGQGRKPCSRCHAGAAAEAREGLLAGHTDSRSASKLNCAMCRQKVRCARAMMGMLVASAMRCSASQPVCGIVHNSHHQSCASPQLSC